MENKNFLILINNKNKFSEDMKNQFEYVEIPYVNGKTQIIREVYEALVKLQNIMLEKHNKVLVITSVMRSYEEQMEIYEEIKAIHGEEYAKRTVAPPDESEHRLGIALDVGIHKRTPVDKIAYQNSLFSRLTLKLLNESSEEKEEMYEMLHKELADCGFILRYKSEKSHITGVKTYEPWHIRYVGVEHAKEIEKLDMCLEEYVEYLETKTTLNENNHVANDNIAEDNNC